MDYSMWLYSGGKVGAPMLTPEDAQRAPPEGAKEATGCSSSDVQPSGGEALAEAAASSRRAPDAIARAIERDDAATVQAWLTGGGRVTDMCKGVENSTVKYPALPMLAIAAGMGHDQVVAVLLQHGADSDEHYEGGLTPLMNAAKNGHLRVAEKCCCCTVRMSTGRPEMARLH